MRDWPGMSGPLVHVPDPLFPTDALVTNLAETVAPRYRVVTVAPRGSSPLQVDAVDLFGVLVQFGFTTPVLVGERLGCVTALLVSAWYPDRVAGLVLFEPIYAAPNIVSIAARALRDCPPDLAALRTAIRCPVLEAESVEQIEPFLTATLP